MATLVVLAAHAHAPGATSCMRSTEFLCSLLNVSSSCSTHAHAQNLAALPSHSGCEGHTVLCRPLESKASKAETVGPRRRRVTSSCSSYSHSDHGFTSHFSINHHDRKINRSTGGTRRKAGRSTGWQIYAEKDDRGPGNEEEGPGEPGPSGKNNTGGEGKEDEGLDVEAKFRLQITDWRAFRARLVKGASLGDESNTGNEDQQQKRWAHPLVEPEKGCLLIAHPTAFGSRQTYFNQAVIFLFEHGQDGSAGFILNRPTSYALGQVPGFEKFEPEFVDSRLYMGGDVGTNLIQVMHGVPGLRDSREVISGVYLGGPNAVKESVKGGESIPDDYRWFLGYCGWRPGQLEREVALGVWYLASGSKDIITDQCIRLKRPLWRQVLELMGGEYTLMSRRAYGEL